MKNGFNQLFKLGFISMASALLCGQAGAVVTVNIRADQPVVNQTSKITYGGGFDYINADMEVMFTDVFGNGTGSSVDAAPAYNMLKNQNLGLYRFPGGNLSFLYRWDNPCGSVGATSPQCTEYLTPDDIQKLFIASTGTSKRPPLNTPAMFQVNTIFSWVNNDWKPIYKTNSDYTPFKQNGLYTVDETVDGGLERSATSAANWVANNRAANNGTTQVEYWEIGNEDWARWTPEQYATIFNKVATKMIAANGGTVLANGSKRALKLIAQTSPLVHDYTSPIVSNLGINQTAGINFLPRFAAELQRQGFNLANIHGVAVHPYLDGNKQTTIEARTSAMFAKIDDNNNEAQTTLNNIVSIGGGASNWKVLITEYNVMDTTDINGNTIPKENKAHALILADWSANMLSRGVDKLLPHSLASDPTMALFMYRDNGYTLTNPRFMTTGAAFSYLAKAFQGSVYRTDNDAGLVNGVKGLSSYAVQSPDKTFNVFLVNRNLQTQQDVKLQLTAPVSLNFKTPGSFNVSTFGDSATTLSTNNFTSDVAWTTPSATSYVRYCSASPRTCTISNVFGGAINITVPAGGMVHVKVPVE